MENEPLTVLQEAEISVLKRQAELSEIDRLTHCYEKLSFVQGQSGQNRFKCDDTLDYILSRINELVNKESK